MNISSLLSFESSALTLSEGDGSGPSRGLQECSDWQDPDSESMCAIQFTVMILIAQKDEDTALPKLFYSKVACE